VPVLPERLRVRPDRSSSAEILPTREPARLPKRPLSPGIGDDPRKVGHVDVTAAHDTHHVAREVGDLFGEHRGDRDRAALRDAGFSDDEIFDIADTAGFFNMSNRVASGVDMIPNPEYHRLNR